jgi:putative component of membrane protein insertase Oxa1/YidC/SpoIIIJ protein YidD
MMWFAITVVFLLVLNALSAGVCNWYCSRREVLSEFYNPFSIAWAWASGNDVCVEAGTLAECAVAVSQHREPRPILFNWPWSNLFILLIVFYQYSNQFPGVQVCVMTPNCSNYAIGMLRRYGLFYAGVTTWVRVRSCGDVAGFRV